MGNIEGVMDRCKCCLDETDLKDMWSDYCNNGEKEIYGEMLNNCFALSWERQPEMDTEYICDKCIARLRDAYSFKKEILRSDQLLKDKQMEVDSKDIKKEEESDEEIETEYIYEEYLEDECEGTDNSGTTLPQNIKQDKEVLEKEELDKEELDKEVLDKEVLDKEVLDKEVLDKEVLNKEVLDKKVLDKKVLPTERKKKYTEEDVEKCVEAVTTQSLSQTKASLLFNVPRTAISRAIARPHETSSKTINTKTQERRKHVDIETVRNIHRKFPEFVHFAEDVNTVLDCSNATPIRSRGGIGYKCCFCPDEFPDAADLKRHTLDQHDSMTRQCFINGTYTSVFAVKLDVTFLQCSLCKSDVNSLEELIDHLINIHGEDIHRNIKNHILPFKFLGDELKCTICDVSFYRFKVLQEHMNTHFRNFICDECDAGFATRMYLLRHIRRHEVGSFKCRFCPKTYNTNSKRRYHESSVHTQKSMFRKCGYCKEKFVSIEKKEAHLVEVHGVKVVTFPCLACEMTYTNFRALREHTKRKHLMMKRHACTECDMKFYSAYGLSRHMIRHNGIKKFKCAECLKSYARKSTLREHMRIHANDRRFKCEYCGRAFVQKCSWRLHMRAKHNEIR